MCGPGWSGASSTCSSSACANSRSRMRGEREECLRGVQNRVVDLLDSWHTIFEDYRSAGVTLQYQKYESKRLYPSFPNGVST